MSGTDIFDLYRQALVIVVGSYSVIRLGNFIWRWQIATQRADRREALLRRYLVVSLLRIRLRRCWLELVQIAALTGLLAYLLWLHAR